MEKLDRTQNAQFWGLKTWIQGARTPASPGSASDTCFQVPTH